MVTPEALAQTHAAAFTRSRPWDATEFADLLGKPGVILCGDARSFLVGRVVAGEAEVLTVATHPDFQRQGLAAKCVEMFLSSVRADAVFLEVSAENEAAKALYFNVGFTEAGRRKAYYATPDGTRTDALILRKSLAPSRA